MPHLSDGLRWLLGIRPYSSPVLRSPDALRRTPTWYGARGNGHVRPLEGLTPDEARALALLEHEQRMIRARVMDSARRRHDAR
jgi:hypothetical protein